MILKNIRREGWQWREYVELREGVEKRSRSLKNPPFSETIYGDLGTADNLLLEEIGETRFEHRH